MSGIAIDAPAAHLSVVSPEPQHRLEPMPWLRAKTPATTFGTITHVDGEYVYIVVDGKEYEEVHLRADVEVCGVFTGWLPLALFTVNTQQRLHIGHQAYDVQLASGIIVENCFPRADRMLEIAHPYRQFSYEEIARIRQRP